MPDASMSARTRLELSGLGMRTSHSRTEPSSWMGTELMTRSAWLEIMQTSGLKRKSMGGVPTGWPSSQASAMSKPFGVLRTSKIAGGSTLPQHDWSPAGREGRRS